jgi:hypothetical protein
MSREAFLLRAFPHVRGLRFFEVRGNVAVFVPCPTVRPLNALHTRAGLDSGLRHIGSRLL